MKARILNASTSGNESNSSILKVRMNFNKRKNASRVRVSRALSKAHRQMNPLRVENVKLTYRKKNFQKCLERLRKKVLTNSPRSKAKQPIKEIGLSK